MGYLLNVVYLLLIVAASPWLVYSAIRKGKYRTGSRRNFSVVCLCAVANAHAYGCMR